ncbi:MAG: GNAT family N-acetyltransferase [Actinomycetes bacterium]
MTRLRLTVGDRDDDGEVETELRRRLYAFNAAATGIDDGSLLVLTVLEDNGRLVAGLFGWTWGGTGFVDLLFVDEGRRGSGLGGRLLTAAEDEASHRGCNQMLLSTHTFQALGFYLARGYVEQGRFPDYPTGHAQVQLAKRLRD